MINDLTQNIKSIKSPLRYPGGKSRAVKKILDLLPSNLDCLCSPFVGGGSVELALVAQGVNVKAYDVFEPLVNFWQVLLDDAPHLARLVSQYYPLTRTEFYNLQKQYFTFKDKFHLASVFYSLNRSSFSGTTLSGGMSIGHPRFTDKGIKALANFTADGFSVEQADFKESIKRHKTDFLYLDPPYANNGKLYGNDGDCHVNFDHDGLAKLLKKRDGWLLSYNDCEEVRDLYNGFYFLKHEWNYGMNTSKKSNELFILSNSINL